MNDTQRLLDKLNEEMRAGRPIEEIEKAWTHFYAVKSYCENYRSNDKHVMAALEQLLKGLSAFTSDVRQGLPSPYSGFRTSISTLRDRLDYDVDNDGWPKRKR